jgi:Mn-dependent DtxR family transcriptional regulator
MRTFLANNVRAALSAPLAKRRNRITKDHLAEVAQIYKKAVDAGEHPTQAVAKAMNVSHSAASKYVGKAREEGFLDKTRQGVAGKRGRA